MHIISFKTLSTLWPCSTVQLHIEQYESYERSEAWSYKRICDAMEDMWDGRNCLT